MGHMRRLIVTAVVRDGVEDGAAISAASTTHPRLLQDACHFHYAENPTLQLWNKVTAAITCQLMLFRNVLIL